MTVARGHFEFPEVSTFTPAETEEITGWKVGSIRQLRRRGHIHGAHFAGNLHRFDAGHLGALLALKALSDAGAAPAIVKHWAGPMGDTVLSWALSDRAAWGSDEEYQDHCSSESRRLDRFAVVFPQGGGIALVDEPARAFNGAPARLAGTVVDLMHLGALLRERAGRPLMRLGGQVLVAVDDGQPAKPEKIE